MPGFSARYWRLRGRNGGKLVWRCIRDIQGGMRSSASEDNSSEGRGW